MANSSETEITITESTGKGQTGSTLSMDYGRRIMKAYAITNGELSQVFGLGHWATLCFSLGFGFGGIALDITKEIFIQQALPETTKAILNTVNYGSYIASGFFILVGIVLMCMRYGKVKEIKKETIFSGP